MDYDRTATTAVMPSSVDETAQVIPWRNWKRLEDLFKSNDPSEAIYPDIPADTHTDDEHFYVLGWHCDAAFWDVIIACYRTEGRDETAARHYALTLWLEHIATISGVTVPYLHVYPTKCFNTEDVDSTGNAISEQSNPHESAPENTISVYCISHSAPPFFNVRPTQAMYDAMVKYFGEAPRWYRTQCDAIVMQQLWIIGKEHNCCEHDPRHRHLKELKLPQAL